MQFLTVMKYLLWKHNLIVFLQMIWKERKNSKNAHSYRSSLFNRRKAPFYMAVKQIERTTCFLILVLVI